MVVVVAAPTVAAEAMVVMVAMAPVMASRGILGKTPSQFNPPLILSKTQLTSIPSGVPIIKTTTEIPGTRTTPPKTEKKSSVSPPSKNTTTAAANTTTKSPPAEASSGQKRAREDDGPSAAPAAENGDRPAKKVDVKEG